MKKITLFLFFIFALMIVGSSCNDTKTAQELLKEEKKATDRFINKNGFVILSEYPEDGVFGAKEFYRTSEGLYIHVIDSGNGKRARLLKDKPQVRFEGMQYFKTDTIKTDLAYYTTNPVEFIYGNQYSYTNSLNGWACDGWAIPLSYVGEEAIVSLIIPSALGNTTDKNNFKPVYFEKLKYTRFY